MKRLQLKLGSEFGILVESLIFCAPNEKAERQNTALVNTTNNVRKVRALQKIMGKEQGKNKERYRKSYKERYRKSYKERYTKKLQRKLHKKSYTNNRFGARASCTFLDP